MSDNDDKSGRLDSQPQEPTSVQEAAKHALLKGESEFLYRGERHVITGGYTNDSGETFVVGIENRGA